MTAISTTAALAAALTAAQGGETFTLAAGPFDSLGLRGVKPASPVTIASADPSNPAVFAGMEFDGCSGLAFRDLRIGLNARTQSVCDVSYSSDISFQRVEFADHPGSDAPGLLFKNSSNVSVDSSTFHDCGTFVRNVNSDHITISNSTFHDGQGDGIQSNGSSYVTLTGNRFTDFHSAAGDHPDAMQFFTYGQTVPATHIEVGDNVVVRGAGSIVQGVFMGNEAQIPYEDVSIHDNAIVGGMYNGIAMNAAKRVNVSRNLVQPYADMGSWIDIGPVDGLTMDGNAATQICTAGSTNVTVTNTKTIAAVPVGDMTALDAWLAAKNAAAAPPPATAVDPLQATVDSLTAQVADLTAKLGTATAQVATDQTTIANFNSQNAALKAQVTSLQAATSAAQVKSLQSQVTALQGKIAKAKTDLA
jgi:hypothetical protein